MLVMILLIFGCTKNKLDYLRNSYWYTENEFGKSLLYFNNDSIIIDLYNLADTSIYQINDTLLYINFAKQKVILNLFIDEVKFDTLKIKLMTAKVRNKVISHKNDLLYFTKPNIHQFIEAKSWFKEINNEKHIVYLRKINENFPPVFSTTISELKSGRYNKNQIQINVNYYYEFINDSNIYFWEENSKNKIKYTFFFSNDKMKLELKDSLDNKIKLFRN